MFTVVRHVAGTSKYETMHLRSAFVAGGFRVAQLVRIAREPSHCPFMAVIAVSASCAATEQMGECSVSKKCNVKM